MRAHVLDTDVTIGVEAAIKKVLSESADSRGVLLTLNSMSEIMESIRVGGMIPCLFADEDDKALGLALVKIMIDEFTAERNLLIYAAATFEYTTLDLWDSCFKAVSELARRWDCKNIVAYTAVERIKRLMARWGGKPIAYIKIPL